MLTLTGTIIYIICGAKCCKHPRTIVYPKFILILLVLLVSATGSLFLNRELDTFYDQENECYKCRDNNQKSCDLVCSDSEIGSLTEALVLAEFLYRLFYIALEQMAFIYYKAANNLDLSQYTDLTPDEYLEKREKTQKQSRILDWLFCLLILLLDALVALTLHESHQYSLQY